VVSDESSHASSHRGRDRRRDRVRIAGGDAWRYGHEVTKSESIRSLGTSD